jgi:hypothetical protein
MKEKKDRVRFNFLIEEDLKNRFVKVCEENDSIASLEIRKFIKKYLSEKAQKKFQL